MNHPWESEAAMVQESSLGKDCRCRSSSVVVETVEGIWSAGSLSSEIHDVKECSCNTKSGRKELALS